MKKKNQTGWGPIIALVVGAIVIFIGAAFLMRNMAGQAKQRAIQARTAAAVASSKKAASASARAIAASKRADAKHLKQDPVYRQYQRFGMTYAEVQKARQLEVTGIGDSVMLGSKAGYQAIFPHMTIDAVVGRSPIQAPELVQKAKAAGKLADTVIIGLGTNGPMDAHLIQQTMRIIGPKRQAFWINNRAAGRKWIAPNNAALAQVEKKTTNLTVIDWYGFSSGNADWFGPDGVHPTVAARPYYYTFVAMQVLRTLAQH